MGGVIELRKAGRSGCRLPSEMEEGNTAAALFASGCPVLRSRRARARQENNMHENREISSTPLLVEEGRSAKAINHNADMHVLEKSDCAVVPMNRPNNGRQLPAEVGEGRAQLEENIVGTHMLLTRAGISMSQCSAMCVAQTAI